MFDFQRRNFRIEKRGGFPRPKGYSICNQNKPSKTANTTADQTIHAGNPKLISGRTSSPTAKISTRIFDSLFMFNLLLKDKFIIMGVCFFAITFHKKRCDNLKKL